LSAAASRVRRASGLAALAALAASAAIGVVGCDEGADDAGGTAARESPARGSAEREAAREATETSANRGATAAGEPEPCAERALAATDELKRALKTRLMAAMREGPDAAVTVCADEAEAIRARVAEETGARIGRTSEGLRNPANAAAPEWARRYLAEPHRVDGAFAPWSERVDGEAHAVAPLPTGGLCLTCHGAEVPPPVQANLDERYPEDRATGFAEGDLRGVVWAALDCE